MKYTFKPYQELIIGLALYFVSDLIIEEYVNKPLGNLLALLGILICIIAVIHGIARLFTKKPLKIVRQTCMTIVSSYKQLSGAHPRSSNEELYRMLLESRYQDGLTAIKLTSKAKNNVGPNYFQAHNLRAVTLTAILHETGLQRSHFGDTRENKLIDDIVKEIKKQIPETL